MTDVARLNEIKERLKDRSGGKWKTVEFENYYNIEIQAERPVGCDEEDQKVYLVCEIYQGDGHGYQCSWGARPNAKFIANAPDDIEYLVKEVERLANIPKQYNAVFIDNKGFTKQENVPHPPPRIFRFAEIRTINPDPFPIEEDALAPQQLTTVEFEFRGQYNGVFEYREHRL